VPSAEEWLTQPGGLADRLLRLRKSAGLTQSELAGQFCWPRTKIPKVENGRQMPSEADITAWADACGQSETVPELLALLAETRAVHRQYRHQLRRGGHTVSQQDLDRLVRESRYIRNFEITLIPGLLQTPDYARYRLREAMRITRDDEDRLDAAVAARMRRQEVLYDSGRDFEFVVMEVALRIRNCPAGVMLAQLDRLLGVTGLKNVTFGIVPLDVMLTATPYTGFLILDDLTYVETHASEDFLSGPESVRYQELADSLRADAVTEDAARKLITAAAEHLLEKGSS
jgi:transcriptional regulator with XRE-family HTH domain